MSRLKKFEKKLAVLDVVKSKRDIIFSSLQNVTKKQKEDAWNEILAKAQLLGLASPNRTWTYARDSIFGLWKSRTLAKRDNSKKTGTGGRRASVFDVVDEAILDIIGESPTVEGIYSPEASGDGVSSYEPDVQLSQIEIARPTRKRKAPAEDDEIPTLKTDDEIITLQRDLLRIKIYKAKLESLKLERELGLPSSEFTEDIYKGEDSQGDSEMADASNYSIYATKSSLNKKGRYF